MSPARPLRAAVVGAGLMGRWHSRAIERAGSVVAVVIDRDAERAARLATRHRARTAVSLRAVAGAIDVVHICTPDHTHIELTREAIDLGVHALVEKPLTQTAAEAAELLECAAASGVLVCPVHQFPFQRGVRRIIGELSRIGPVLHLATTICSAGADAGGAAERDRIAAEILPHPLSLFAAVLPSATLADVHWAATATAPGELRAIGSVDGVGLSLLISMGGRPTRNSLDVIGSAGSAHADLFHGFATVAQGNVSRASKITQPFRESGSAVASALVNIARRAATGQGAYPGLWELVAAFHAAVRGEGPAPIVPARTVDLATARDALRERIAAPLAGASSDRLSRIER